MIEGLHFDVSAQEFLTHLHDRCAYHMGRVQLYETQHRQLSEGGAEAAQFTNGDPLKSLQASREKHESLLAKFQFMAAHLVAGEVYRLSEANLADVEFIKSRQYY